MKAIKSFTFVLLFLLINSCGTNKAINPLNSLIQNSWALHSVLGESLDMSQFDQGVPSLDFLEGGRLAGFSGCNNFSGSFSLEGNNIRLDPGAITRRACADSGEQVFIAALEIANNLKIKKDRLTLLDGEKELMSFIPKYD